MDLERATGLFKALEDEGIYGILLESQTVSGGLMDGERDYNVYIDWYGRITHPHLKACTEVAEEHNMHVSIFPESERGMLRLIFTEEEEG